MSPPALNNPVMSANSFNPHEQRRINVRSLLCVLLAFLGLFATPGRAGAQIFVPNFGDGTVGKYSTSGEPLAPALISGLVSPRASQSWETICFSLVLLCLIMVQESLANITFRESRWIKH
jgi:hypothetical protein